ISFSLTWVEVALLEGPEEASAPFTAKWITFFSICMAVFGLISDLPHFGPVTPIFITKIGLTGQSMQIKIKLYGLVLI
ncbi:MAG: hypothetical protein WBZ33_06760, partial [Thermoactinomyces sp.]